MVPVRNNLQGLVDSGRTHVALIMGMRGPVVRRLLEVSTMIWYY